MPDPGSIDLTRTALLILGGLIAWGTFLGATRRIVVFRDASDLLTTFAMIAGWVAAGYFLGTFGGGQADFGSTLLRYAFGAALIAILCRMIAGAYADNGNLWGAMLAVMTKLPYSIVVPLLVLQAAAPTGRTAAKRASGRASALFFLAIFTPLVLALIHDKSDFNKIMRLGRRGSY